jgi:hypothetical protein
MRFFGIAFFYPLSSTRIPQLKRTTLERVNLELVKTTFKTFKLLSSSKRLEPLELLEQLEPINFRAQTLSDPLEYNAQCPVGSERFQIQHGLARGDLEPSIHSPEGVRVTPDQRIDLPAAYSVDQKRRVHQDFFIDSRFDPHVGDKATSARPGKFAMRMPALQPLHPPA